MEGVQYHRQAGFARKEMFFAGVRLKRQACICIFIPIFYPPLNSKAGIAPRLDYS
jgi:hypothetical protein